MRPNGQQGFTLLELLITVAIIGILAGIGLPQYASYRDRAEKASIMSDGRSIFRGFLIFYIENSGFPCEENECADNTLNFNPVNFDPLNNAQLMGTDKLDFSITIPRLIGQLKNGRVDLYKCPDNLGEWQQFYLAMAWKKDPEVTFIIAQSDAVRYDPAAPGSLVEGGKWIDGVYATKAGAIMNR